MLLDALYFSSAVKYAVKHKRRKNMAIIFQVTVSHFYHRVDFPFDSMNIFGNVHNFVFVLKLPESIESI